MFYKINPVDKSIVPIKYTDIDSNKIQVGYITLPEMNEIFEVLGFDDETYEQCYSKTATFQNSPLVFRSYTFGIIHTLTIQSIEQPQEKFAFFLMKHLLLIVDLYDTNRRTMISFNYMLERCVNMQNVTLPFLFASFLTNFIIKDNQILEIMDLKLEELENEVLEMNSKDLRQKISQYRRKLVILKNYYEQFLAVTDDIIENVNQLFDTQQFFPLKMLQRRIERLSNHARDLSEYVSQIKDSYMAQLDINLNSIMKVFTIVTTVFMPLTLIVGWYGMNFKFMPELSWKYGYLWVIILSIMAFSTTLLWFKKKHFF